MSSFPVTAKTQVKRLPDRGAYDRETIYPILDEGVVCHAGFQMDGQPFVMPTGYARDGDRLLLHGSAASRMMRTLASGVPVCITVTLIDGLVMAKSAFHHSMNFRSVVVFGVARPVDDSAAKWEALRAFTEHIAKGRWAEVRQPNEKELKATQVVEIPIEEASAKVRTGPPKDDPEDLSWPAWSGVVPLSLVASNPDSSAPKYLWGRWAAKSYAFRTLSGLRV